VAGIASSTTAAEKSRSMTGMEDTPDETQIFVCLHHPAAPSPDQENSQTRAAHQGPTTAP
jgi:hypothetical protein